MRLVRLEAFWVSYPWSGKFKFFRGNIGHQAIVVKITTDTGLVGWGQSVYSTRWSYESPEAGLAAIARYFGPAIMGLEPTEIGTIHRALDAALAPGLTIGMPQTRAGIDLAVHDLAAKSVGLPISKLWNRSPGSSIRLSWTINVTELDDVYSQLEEGRNRGYRNFNLKVAPNVAFDLALAKLVRTLAPGAFLWVDANCGYDFESARKALKGYADIGVDAFESPLPPTQIEAYRWLRRQAAIPIIMDEGVITPEVLLEFIRLGVLDGLAIKVSRSGGLWSARRQLELIQDAGLLALGSGLTDPEISLVASLHLFSAFSLRLPAALNGPQFLQADVLAKPIRIVADEAFPPEGPGLGIEVDEAKLWQLLVSDPYPLQSATILVEGKD